MKVKKKDLKKNKGGKNKVAIPTKKDILITYKHLESYRLLDQHEFITEFHSWEEPSVD